MATKQRIGMWLPGDQIFALEQGLEDEAIKIAKKRGWRTRKFKHPGRRFAPDRWFARDGYIFWVEFKRQLNEPTEGQYDEIDFMRAAGLDVIWVDSIEDFVACLTIRENA